MKKVSVIILSYHPVWEKLKLTIKSVLFQKDIDFEIIIADDGSEDNNFEAIEALFDSYGFKEYTLLAHPENVGTVRNYCDALAKCEGEYVYGISPGDFFYDAHTLKKLYDFCQQRQCAFCFGDAVYYREIDYGCGEISLAGNASMHPYDPEVFDKQEPHCFDVLALSNNNILGAAYFRKTEAAKKYIGAFAGISRYLEDYPSLMYAVAEKESVAYYADYVVWYENGTGVSTGNNEKWLMLLGKDYKSSYEYLAEKYKNEKNVCNCLNYLQCDNKREKLLFLLKGHPLLLLKKLLIKLRADKKQNKKAHKKVICYDFFDKLMTERIEEKK